eukprot:TRINITY_DN12191_c0_g1_i19.p1 TRINITY_DN12191_c0_g1~~TRINITY_DN12191_c0_g1_i19.p1  ORF type:complete len:385 (-),score=83.14 TRINITY_DN12191_c0_g1_i19:45-1199(-)
MLEVHELKQRLSVTRKELSQALYQHEAACRVIARLTRERNLLREEAVKLRNKSTEDKKEVKGINQVLSKKLTELSDALSAVRKSRKPPVDLTPNKRLAEFKEEYSASLHSGKITSIEISPNGSFTLTGGKDCAAHIHDLNKRTTVTSITHTEKITAVAFVDASLSSIVCSSDGLGKAWEMQSDYSVRPSHSFNTHTASISSCAVHPNKQHCLLFSKDGSWSMNDLIEGGITQIASTEGPISSGGLHPDGLIVGAGLDNGAVMLWDIRSQDNFHRQPVHEVPVKAVCYSEKGYQMATLCKGEVQLWDLRKLGESVTVGERKAKGVIFDWHGVCIGMCGEVVEVYGVKKRNKVMSVGEGSFTCLRFGAKNEFVVAGTSDGLLKIFN